GCRSAAKVRARTGSCERLFAGVSDIRLASTLYAGCLEDAAASLTGPMAAPDSADPAGKIPIVTTGRSRPSWFVEPLLGRRGEGLDRDRRPFQPEPDHDHIRQGGRQEPADRRRQQGRYREEATLTQQIQDQPDRQSDGPGDQPGWMKTG